MTKKLTQEYIKKELQKIGFTAISEYITAKAPLTARCPNGHIRTSTWDNVRHGECGECAGNVPYTEDDYIQKGIENNLKWIGVKIPPNSTTPTIWMCQGGHTFHRPVGAIVFGGNKCPVCTRRRKLVESDYYQMANSIGIEWLGPKPNRNSGKTKWKCSAGHIFETSYKSVSHRGEFAGCKECWRKAFTGAGHPRWKGGDKGANKHRNRLKRYDMIEKNNAVADILTNPQWKLAKIYFSYSCAYCKRMPQRLQKEHFIPVVEGGQHTAQNVLPVCPSCNHSKGGKNPIEWLTDKFGFYEGADIYHSVLEYFEQVI